MHQLVMSKRQQIVTTAYLGNDVVGASKEIIRDGYDWVVAIDQEGNVVVILHKNEERRALFPKCVPSSPACPRRNGTLDLEIAHKAMRPRITIWRDLPTEKNGETKDTGFPFGQRIVDR